MNEFMKILLSLSASGTLLLFLISGLKLLYRNKFSRRWQYYIWITAALRFLIPFAPGAMNMGEVLKAKQISVKMQMAGNAAAPVIMNNSMNIYMYLFFIWASVTLILLIRKVTIYRGFVRYIKAGSTEVSDIKTLNLFSACKEKLNIGARVELYRNRLITSPVMAGFFHPCIVLPDGELKDEVLSHIFMHELIHYKQRDIFYKWLIQAVVCIHWFNPFVHLLEKEVNKDCELSCDEAVISMLDTGERREYGDMLIYFVKQSNLYKGSSVSATLTEGAEQLKERLGAIMNFNRKTKSVCVLMCILTLVIVAGASFAGVYPVCQKSVQTDEASVAEESMEADRNGKDKALREAYAVFDIEKSDNTYYCEGEPVYLLKNQYPDGSFYVDINAGGRVSIQVIWNTEGEITGVFYMSDEEVEGCLGDGAM